MPSKKVLILLLVIVGGALVWYTKKSSDTLPQNETRESHTEVLMKTGMFDPSELTVETGTKVIFKNADENTHWPASNLHPTHGIYPEFDPKKAIGPGDEWSFTFDKAGKWKYHDHLFPQIRGTINVD